VVDFGISGLYNSQDKSNAGSLKYMAPEVLSGKNTTAEPELDIFSMGVILYALVTQKLPFDGEPEIVKQKIIAGEY
jgi:carbon catabolite-derepressing protein kinase